MKLQEQIKKDLTAAMKAKDEDKKSTLRVLMGEFGRIDAKELEDDQIIKIMKKLIKSERETLERSGVKEETPFIGILEAYLPKMASEDEIKAWIQDNVDFSQYKNKMQSMRDIMQHFGSEADGNTVKKILQDF